MSVQHHWTRRAFTLSAIAAAANPVGIIDTHTHFYDPRRPGGVPWPPPTDQLLYQPYLPPRFAALAQPLDVTGTVVVEASPWLEDNQWILDLAKDHPIIRGVVGHLDPAGAGYRAHLDRFSRNPHFRGIRLGEAAIRDGLGNRAFLSGLERLAGAGLALDAIGGAPLFEHLVKVSDRVPKLRVVIDHLPFLPGTHADAFRELGRRPQIFAKVSGVLRSAGGRVPLDTGFYRKDLDELWSAFGENRVVYASNWPVSERLGRYAEVLRVVQDYVAGKGADASARFFRENSKTAYQWLARS